ncbi:DUF2237 domain-containing protein [Algoriphagus sp. H41]|uniref:DUF2237 domain-containing protein n=1 Tax=Algoriphagus oliviformis TaxID=2811231 RepID=A0ABS3C490_9BACT|nr:DUF2237 domain-containing protein [Algoriphagus oliviformis]MBN7811917.1 DUF2237 domain-containing protein [Algoriphagus oliviformis]
MAKNVFGENLIPCSMMPLTGFFRTGCCETDEEDRGMHTVCAVMSDTFLRFSKGRGNDLSTPRPEYGFPGLQAGDKWCLCASRWMEAYQWGCAPLVYLEATDEATLDIIPLELLVSHALKTV